MLIRNLMWASLLMALLKRADPKVAHDIEQITNTSVFVQSAPLCVAIEHLMPRLRHRVCISERKVVSPLLSHQHLSSLKSTSPIEYRLNTIIIKYARYELADM